MDGTVICIALTRVIWDDALVEARGCVFKPLYNNAVQSELEQKKTVVNSGHELSPAFVREGLVDVLREVFGDVDNKSTPN